MTVRVLHSVSNMDRAGIETMLMNYYRHMDRDRIQFDFLCNKRKPGAYDGEILAMGGRIFRTPGLNPLKYPAYLAYMKALFHDHPEYAIVEAHNGALGVYALHAAKVNGIPVRIFHAHGANNAKNLKRPLKAFCKSRLDANLTLRFSCGAAAARFYYGKRIAGENRYTLIPNAIELDRFAFDERKRNALRKQYGLEGSHVIGHVGRFMAQKNHAFLLDVFAALREMDSSARLVLLGDGELLQSMKEKAQRLGLADTVLFAGNVANASEWYQAFDCFVLPSLWEGLPVVGVEAQTADLPCVFSKSVTPEIGITDRARFIALREGREAWARAIMAALEGGGVRRDNTRLMAAAHYDIAREAKALQAKYLELAGVTDEDRHIDASVYP